MNTRNFSNLFRSLLLILILTGATMSSLAADGDLDTSFDGDGRAVTDFLGDDVASEVIQLPDGKLLVLGLVNNGTRNGLARYNTDGTLDTTFGTGGKFVIEPLQALITALKLQPDGKLVGSTNDGSIIRMNADGSLDATLITDDSNFRPNGIRRIRINGENFDFYDMVVQPDGKYVFATSMFVTTPVIANVFAVVRCNANGTTDTSFGTNGVQTTNSPRGVAHAVDLAPDNKIIVAGYSADTPNNQGTNVAVMQYNTDGTLDATFSGDGKAFGSRIFSTAANNTRLAVHTDGKIAVARNFTDPNFNIFYVAKFGIDGTLDGGFGTGGEVIRPANTYGISFAHELIFQPDGKIIVFGQAQPGPADSNYGFLVARYNLNGEPDSSFGTNGSKVIQFFYTVNMQTRVAVAQAGSGLLQADGKIVVVGHATFENANGLKNWTLARLLNSASQPPVNNPAQRIADFDGDGRTDASVFRNDTWFINPSSNPGLSKRFSNRARNFYGVQFGLQTDKLTPADFDGDGKTDIAVWRENTGNPEQAVFYILNSTNNTTRIEPFGRTGDSPIVVGDWDGDGKADPAVYRGGASGQSFFYYRPSTNTNVSFTTVYWGTSGDKPMRGDFDGDAKMDAAVFRPSDNTWYILQSQSGQARYDYWGLASDKFVPADYDGDGKTDLAVFRNGVWYLKQSSDNQPIYKNWGLDTDSLVPGDYDGDRKADVAVWREGVFYIMQTTNSQAAYLYFGTSGDRTIASAFWQ